MNAVLKAFQLLSLVLLASFSITPILAQSKPPTLLWDVLNSYDVTKLRPHEKVGRLQSQKVRIPGFVMVNEFGPEGASEFLLVPGRDFCIHVPPPGPTQSVFVKMKKGIKVNTRVAEPIWVYGTLKVRQPKNEKQIYELVLKAQEEAMKICRPGASFRELTIATRITVNKGLADLGIIKTPDEKNTYYPHGCCHHIGLDVHDRGTYDKLQENMIVTIEPGIYIPEGAPCDKKWWGIAVRIEDDYLITKDGYDHLSVLAPRTVKDIEAAMKLPSPLDNFILPELGKEKKN
jgi:hypothetical protein